MSETHSHLITGTLLLVLFFRQHHPQGKETHHHAVAEVTEHHSEQKGECYDGVGSCQIGRKNTFILNFLHIKTQTNKTTNQNRRSSYLGLPHGSPPLHTPPQCSEIQL